MIKLKDIVEKIQIIKLDQFEDMDISAVSNNSKNIKDKTIFVAVKGSIFDGHKYIDDAIDRGARAIVYEDDIKLREGISYIKVKNSRKTFADISNIIYDFPSKKMKLIAVTGTNGKTTVSKLCQFLVDKILGPCANIGTDGAVVADELIHTDNTTPDINVINYIMDRALSKGIKNISLEASSHGLDQKRLEGINFDVGILNNLSTEHLDYHKTMENYFQAKLSLFKNSKIKIVNADDPYGKRAKEIYKDAISFGINSACTYKAYDIKKDTRSISFKVNGVDFRINTIADYEIYNSLAAIAALNQLGASLEDIAKVIYDFPGVKSRFEFIANKLGKNIIVDFAHTPRAYEEIFKSIPKDKNKIVVFGIQGDRNSEFRKLIGEVVAKNKVFAVITTDDPKFDTYENISEDIISGIKEFNGSYKMIKDRKEAIRFAIQKASKDDYVLMLGKGEEDFIKLKGNEKTPYSEKQTIKEVLEDL